MSAEHLDFLFEQIEPRHDPSLFDSFDTLSALSQIYVLLARDLTNTKTLGRYHIDVLDNFLCMIGSTRSTHVSIIECIEDQAAYLMTLLAQHRPDLFEDHKVIVSNRVYEDLPTKIRQQFFATNPKAHHPTYFVPIGPKNHPA